MAGRGRSGSGEPLLPPCVDVPTGNVRVIPVQRTDEQATAPPPAAGSPLERSAEWVIRDADGAVVETLTGTRAAALRRMGVAALRGASLPLALWGADGQPTGDRLPG